MHRRALLIATGNYADPRLERLRSPAQDVRRLAAVLRAPSLGGFEEVTVCIDQPEHKLRIAIEDVLHDRSRDDLILVYLSCHGIRDLSGRLYFAATDTRLTHLAATALASTFLDEQMSTSAAGGRVLILDCCFSGSFAHGLAVKSAAASPLAGTVGQGYFVLTATDAFEYAFEGKTTRQRFRPRPSIATDAIITGIETGHADRDGDGWVSAYDLYDYVYHVVTHTAPQTPNYFASSVEGRLLLTRVPPTADPPPDPKHEAPVGKQVTHRPGILRRARHATRSTVTTLAILVVVAAVLVADQLSTQSPSPSDSYTAATSGEPMVDDDLRDNRSDNHWFAGTGEFGDCGFANNSYRLRPKQGRYHICCTGNVRRGDFAAQVEMTIQTGDEGGMAFRWNDGAGYFFHVTSSGNYRFFTTDRAGRHNIDLSGSGTPHPAINAGLNQRNVLAVLAQGSTIQLFVNGEHLDTVQDPTYPEGNIALCAERYTNTTQVAFNNFKMWRA